MGRREAGLLTAAKLKSKDPKFYEKIGRIGGQNHYGYGFAHGKLDPVAIGRLGGRPRGITILQAGEVNRNMKPCDDCELFPDGTTRCMKRGTYRAIIRLHKVS